MSGKDSSKSSRTDWGRLVAFSFSRSSWESAEVSARSRISSNSSAVRSIRLGFGLGGADGFRVFPGLRLLSLRVLRRLMTPPRDSQLFRVAAAHGERNPRFPVIETAADHDGLEYARAGAAALRPPDPAPRPQGDRHQQRGSGRRSAIEVLRRRPARRCGALGRSRRLPARCRARARWRRGCC